MDDGLEAVIYQRRWVDGIKDGALVSDAAIADVVREHMAKDGPVKRATRLLEIKRQTMTLVDPAITKAKEDRDWMLVANFEIEKFKLQAEIDLLEFVVNG